MASRLLILIMTVLAVAAVAVGCGGSEPDPLSKAAFVKQGNAICVSATKEREAAMAKAAKEGGENADAGDLINEVALPPTQNMVDELDGLGVPNGAEKQIEAMLTSFEKGIETVEANPREALGSSAFEEANEAAGTFGLTECEI